MPRSVTPTPLAIVPPPASSFTNPVNANGSRSPGLASSSGAVTPTHAQANGSNGNIQGQSLPSPTYGSVQGNGWRNHYRDETSSSASGTGVGRPSTDDYENDEAELSALTQRLVIETKIKDGASNLLHVFRLGNDNREGLRTQVEAELLAANTKIDALERRINELKRGLEGPRYDSNESDEDDVYSDEDSRTAVASALELLQSLSNDHTSVANEQGEMQPVPSTSRNTSIARQDEKIEALNALVQIVHRNERVKWEIPCSTVIQHVLPCLSDKNSQNTRAAAYRALRYLVYDAQDGKELIDHGLELFMIRSLSRNHSYELEKIECLLLIRSWLSGLSRPSPLTVGLVRSLVSLSENTDEKLRHLALETLAELVLFDITLLAKAEGLRVVLQAFLEGPHDLGPAIAQAFLPIMDLPETRALLRPGLDIELVISAFTNASGKSGSNTYDEKLRMCASIIGSYLKTWTGLFYLCMNEKQALRSFLGSLNSSNFSVREAILNTLFEVFKIEPPDSGSISKRNTIRKSVDTVKLRARADSSARSRPPEDDAPTRLNLIEHYQGFLLVILVEAGLFQALLSSGRRDGDVEAFAKKAAHLTGELLQLSNRVLPLKYATQWQTLPNLFAMVADYDNGPARLLGTNALQSIDKMTRVRARGQAAILAAQNSRNRANSLDDPLSRGQRHVENSKIRLGMQMDDIPFRNLLLESQVIYTKEHPKWNYDAMLEIIEGPLLNPKRLDEALKGSKFVRRIITFFHPFEKRYSSLSNTPGNLKWTKLACALLSTLLQSADGLAFLKEDKLLRQIAEALSQLDPQYVAFGVEPIFAEKRFAATMTSGYFTMLGTLSKHPEGLKLMERAKIFTLFYHLTDLKGREDIVTAAIEDLSYENDGHARVILSKALNSSYRHVRLFATKHLGKLLHDTAGPRDWLIRLLVTQLYDTSSEVRELAVSMLNDVCASHEILERVVEMRPSLDHLGPVGAPLLFRFLSTSVGVCYLHQIEFIEREMEHWFHDRNDLYVTQLEVSLAQAMQIGPKDLDPLNTAASSLASSAAFDGVIPLHFYGELVKTSEGRMILDAKGHFREFADFIRTHGMEDTDKELMDKLKSVLWAVGHIGADEGGLTFLDVEGIVGDIVHIASNSGALSVRGTCFFVLGLISSTPEGADMLEANGWAVAYTPLGLPAGYCLPSDVDAFTHIPPWSAQRLSNPPLHNLAVPSSHVEREVVDAIANLSNNLLAHTASRTLAKIKQKYPEVFKSIPVYYRVLHLLRTCHYRATVRSYIIELFEIPLDSESVKGLLEAGEKLRVNTRPPASVPSNSAGSRNSLGRSASEGDSVQSPLHTAASKEIIDGYGKARDAREGDDLPQPQPRKLNLEGIVRNTIYKLNVDTDSEESSMSEDEEDLAAPKEILEPVVLMRGGFSML